MKTDEIVIKMINESKEPYEFVRKNRLFLKFASNVELLPAHKSLYDKCLNNNRLFEIHKRAEICRISEQLNAQGIFSLFFKGSILADQIYKKFYYRETGDIDFWVNERDFEHTLNIMYDMGYVLYYENSLNDEHHVVLRGNKFVVELHKKILNPYTLINEEYLVKSIRKCVIGSSPIFTFSFNATFVHLLYHLYMDLWTCSHSFYSILVNKTLSTTRLFFYRAYEISLYSEMFSRELDWGEIVKEVSSQRLRIIFRKMILDILNIFPMTFPKFFIEAVNKLDYIDDERDVFYKYLIDNKIYKKANESVGCELCDFINSGWNNRSSNICTTIDETVFLVKERKGNNQLTCEIQVSKKANGILLTFEVSIDDLCLSDADTLDGQSSDGIHLLLCGTADNNFSYKSIFFFPKKVNDKYSVVVCDVLSYPYKIIEDDYVQADFELREETYVIRALLSNEYVIQNNLSSYFYMGLVVSDCSNETKRRKNQLVLSDDESQWYNPIYFARVNLD